MIHKKVIIDLPNPSKVKVYVISNLLYNTGSHTLGNSSGEEGDPDFSNHDACSFMEEDIVPSPTHPTQLEARTSDDNQDK